MSGQWEGGKGDKSRVVNLEEYNANYDKIFRKPKKPSYKLFLDDYRNPKDAYLYDSGCSMLRASSTRSFDWDVYRSYRAFCIAIDNRGIPEMVSFDNDLNEGHMQAYITANAAGEYDWSNLKETGIHCALYLIEKCKQENVPFPPFWVHSANHFARKIITDLINAYTKTRQDIP